MTTIDTTSKHESSKFEPLPTPSLVLQPYSPAPVVPSVTGTLASPKRLKKAVEKVILARRVGKKFENELRRRSLVGVLPTDEWNEELSKLNNTYMVTDRARYGFKPQATHPAVCFKPWQFLKTFVYELSPPYINAFVVMLVECGLERKALMEGMYASCHRFFLPHPKFMPLPFLILFTFIFNPILLALWYTFFWGYLWDESTREQVWFQEILVFFFFFVARAAVVSTKYAFFDDAELAALNKPAPDWSSDHTNRKLVGQGWSQPLAFPGLLEEECHHAIALTGADLYASSFDVSHAAAQASRDFDRAWSASIAHKHRFERCKYGTYLCTAFFTSTSLNA
jgi:hypothetical protein